MRDFFSSVVIVVFLIFISGTVFAQDEQTDEKEGFLFTTVKELPHTLVEDQNSSGTCWSFSGVDLLEAEMIRLGKPDVNLSEMFIVWHTYEEKSMKYVRLHGNLTFSAGGAFHDVTSMIRKYGIVPESVYSGLNYGEEKHVHYEMDKVLEEQVKAVVENGNKKLSTAWEDAIQSTLDSYLGKLPETFEYEGLEYTPQSFARDFMDLNMDDYVEISSYTHHPFYERFILEIPDNWMWQEVYNVPLDELEAIIDNAIENDYAVAWAADVSEKGFSTSKDGVAIIPEKDFSGMSDAQIRKWKRLSESEKNDELFSFDKPEKEQLITQEIRQVGFDNYQTTDDHGMLIVGIAKDQNGTLYYKVKNSWGEYNDYDGYFYASKPYIRYKTMSIMVHKDAIPRNIKKKLNL